MAMRSEDEFQVKLDRCFTDIAVKTIGGSVLGMITSLYLFKGRTNVPIYLLTGVGFGVGWNNSKHELQRPFALKVKSDEFGVKLDRCLTNITMKTIGGVGFGAGWNNCQHELQRPFALHAKTKSNVDEQEKPVHTIVTEMPHPMS